MLLLGRGVEKGVVCGDALAAVAVSSAAFAQVTISGKYGVAYQKGIGQTSNLATTDGDIRFSATEDLGGGLTASASMEIRVRGRGNVDAGSAAVAASNTAAIAAQNTGVGGRNATVGLSGGFGSVTMGSVEAGNGIMARGFAGAPVSVPTLIDGAVLSGVANVDWFMYTTPQIMPGLTANLQRVDSVGNPGTDKGLAANVVGLNYAQGALSAGIDYTSFTNDRTRLRYSASYDLGVARIGFGQEDNKKTTGAAGKQTALGVSVPMGAITLGAVYAQNTESISATAASNDTRGYGFGVDYAFSKRTTLNVSYFDRTRSNGAKDDNGDQYRVRLMHSF